MKNIKIEKSKFVKKDILVHKAATAFLLNWDKKLKKWKILLDKFLLLIPEERLREYKNAREIRKSYLEAIKSFPPT